MNTPDRKALSEHGFPFPYSETVGFRLSELEPGCVVMELDCGMRSFTARLDDDLKFVLTNPEGKVVKALPAPRKGEDPEALNAAKKEFSTT